MDTKGMESIIICPDCGEQVFISLVSEEIDGFIKMIESTMGVGKAEHFTGKNKCKCGRTIKAALHVTAEVECGIEKRASFVGM